MDAEEHYRSTLRLKLRWKQLADRSGIPLAELHRVADAHFLFLVHPLTPEEATELEQLLRESEQETQGHPPSPG